MIITNRRIQRRQPVRSMQALWLRTLTIDPRTAAARVALTRIMDQYTNLNNVPEELRDHVWNGDYDSLELRVLRAERAAK